MIIIKAIPHREQRYPTLGDFFKDADNNTIIRVSQELNPQHRFLVTLHEYIESSLCEFRGISWHDIDRFDKNFEQTRDLNDLSEPGDHPDAPYKNEHNIAEIIERIVARELNIDWKEYMTTCEELYNESINESINESHPDGQPDMTHYKRRID